MDLKVPYSLPPKKQTSKQTISDDEFGKILQLLNDSDLGTPGGDIEESASLKELKTLAKAKEIVSGDTESTIFDEARKRTLEGNRNYDFRIYTVKKGDDLRKIAHNLYGNSDNWVLIAAFNNIVNPSSKKEVYPGRKLVIL